MMYACVDRICACCVHDWCVHMRYVRVVFAYDECAYVAYMYASVGVCWVCMHDRCMYAMHVVMCYVCVYDGLMCA